MWKPGELYILQESEILWEVQAIRRPCYVDCEATMMFIKPDDGVYAMKPLLEPTGSRTSKSNGLPCLWVFMLLLGMAPPAFSAEAIPPGAVATEMTISQDLETENATLAAPGSIGQSGVAEEAVTGAVVKTASGTAGGQIFLQSLPTEATPSRAQPRVVMQGEQLYPLEEDQAPVEDQAPFKAQPEDSPSLPPNQEPDQANAPGVLVNQWTALSNTGWYPPDTIHAVGPNHVIEAVNSGFAVYSKTGALVQGYKTFDSFMNKPAIWPAGAFMYDPRVIYDPWHQRFLMLILGLDETTQKSYFWVAVSKTANPNQGWCRWRFDSTLGTTPNKQWLDYAGLGADPWGVYVTGNYFRFGGSFTTSMVWTINPAIFTANCTGASNGWLFTGLTWPTGGSAFSLQPALPHSQNANGQTFFVNSWSGSGNKLLLWKLSGNRAGATAPTLSRVEIPVQQYYAIGNNVRQRGSTVKIDGGDARVMNAVYSQGRVFAPLTSDVNNNGLRSGWLTAKLNTTNNTREWQHLLYSSNGFYYFYPAITIQGGSSANAHLALFGSWTDKETSTTPSQQYASGLVKFYDNQPASSTGPFLNLVSGKGVYNRVFSGRNRWGDYSGAGYDWSTGNAWGSFEWANTNNTWATSISGRNF